MFQGGETIPHETVMVDTRHYARAKPHGMHDANGEP